MRTLIITGLLALTAISASAQPAAEAARTEDLLDQMQDSFRNVADELFSSLIYIEVISGGQLGTGSGFIVDHDPKNNIFYAATNHHVAGGPHDYIRVTSRDGRSFDAVLVGSDPRYDVALIAFEYSTDEVFEWSPSISSIGDSDAVRAGDLVYALGGPRFLPETLTLGVVSNASRESAGIDPGGVREYIQTDAPINPGNSGGPLVSLRDGKVIGINTSIALPLVVAGGGAARTIEGDVLLAQGNIGIGFAVPINVAMRIIGNLKEYGMPRHGYIGVEYSPRGATDVLAACPEDPEDVDFDVDMDVDLDVDDTTLAMILRSLTTVMDVTPLGPADRHGLKPGDIIMTVNGELAPVLADTDRILARSAASYSKLIRMVDALTPGEDSTFEVVRDCDLIEITLQAGVREEEDAGDGALASWPGMLLNAELVVVDVAESGVAAGLGIEVGDVIADVNGAQIGNLRQFYRNIDTCRTERCSLGVYRNGMLSWTPDFVVPR